MESTSGFRSRAPAGYSPSFERGSREVVQRAQRVVFRRLRQPTDPRDEFRGDSVSLWKAADLTPIGTMSQGAGSAPKFACSDGVRFWITNDSSVHPL